MYSILIQKNCQAAEFVDFWSHFYEYGFENLYSENIIKPTYSSDDLKNLFIWKNGMRLSSQKNSSLEKKILRKLDVVNRLKKSFSLEEFNDAFFELSTIWKVFLLHCIQPDNYPIFDQHVFRAMKFIQYSTINEVSKSERHKYCEYLEHYLSFFSSLVLESGRERNKVDRALWYFGKSIKLFLVNNVLNKRG